MPLPLSYLDLCQIEAGSTSAVALRNAVELAQVAERVEGRVVGGVLVLAHGARG